MRFISQAWAVWGPTGQSDWTDLADATKISWFNAYVQHNLARFRNAMGPVQSPLEMEPTTAPSIATISVVGGVRSASVGINPATGTNLAGYIIYRGAGAPAGTWSEIVGVIAANGAADVTFVDSPMDAGTYHYKVKPFHIEGVFDAISLDEEVAVTD
jgi:hypothetical protein